MLLSRRQTILGCEKTLFHVTTALFPCAVDIQLCSTGKNTRKSKFFNTHIKNIHFNCFEKKNQPEISSN